MLNVFLEGNGVGKENSLHETGYGAADLLDAMSTCQLEKDRIIMQDALYSTCIDENEKKCNMCHV